MKRRHFLQASTLGIAASVPAARAFQAPSGAAGPGITGDPAHPLNLFSRTTLTTPITRVASASTTPVLIEEFIVSRHEGGIRLFVRSRDGAVGVARGNHRHLHQLSLLTGLVLPYFAGRDARDLEKHLDEIYVADSRYKYAGMPFYNCIALAELACLDLLATVSGRPVFDLLGEKRRVEFPVYLTRFERANTPQAEVDAVREQIAATGATAVKIKIGRRMGNNRDDLAGRTDALIPLLRKSLPAGSTLYVDANGAYDVPEAIRVGKLLQDHAYGFLEEPCPWQEYEATKAVADALTLPIAGGEQDSSAPTFAWALRHRGLDVVQPDLLYNGGLIRSLRVARMAESVGATCVPHSPGPEFWPYLAHFAAVAPALGPFLEQTAGPQIRGGLIRLPEALGWGWETTVRGEILARVRPSAPAVTPGGGFPVTTTAERRLVLLEKFAAHVYGREPTGLRTGFTWQAPSPNGQQADFEVSLDAPSATAPASRKFSVILHLPPGASSASPVPCVLFLNHRPRTVLEQGLAVDSTHWPVRLLHAAGWAAAAIHLPDLISDQTEEAARDSGILAMDTGPRDDSRPGAVSAWAWAASRAADALLAHPALDPRRLAVAGHSRSGKAALLAGARDERFALVFSNQSGCGGAAHSASKKGERISDITTRFPHWLAPAFATYANREHELPVDQHLLLGCIAPRALFVGSASEDTWADPAAEFRSCQLASALWEIHGMPGLAGGDIATVPTPDSGLIGGRLGYHLRPGKHDLGTADWAAFLRFAKNLPLPQST